MQLAPLNGMEPDSRQNARASTAHKINFLIIKLFLEGLNLNIRFVIETIYKARKNYLRNFAEIT